VPYFIDCPSCRKRLQVAADPAGKRITCRACGAISDVPAAEPVDAEPVPDDADEAEPERPARRPRPSRRPRNWFRVPVLLLLVGYFPLLAFLCLAMAGPAVLLIGWGFYQLCSAEGWGVLGVPAIVLGGALLGTVIHVLAGLRVLFRKPDDKDELEFELPAQWQEGLADLVGRVAAERDLPPPDVIRLHAADVAHVFEDRRGRTVLVVGGLAVAALSQRALGGIIAHELGHVGGGDTSLSRAAHRWHQVMMQLERQFWGRSWYRWNPLAWVVRLYHRLYVLLWFANMRAAEYAADSFEVEHVGKEKAAAALALITALHHMEWAQLGNVAEACVEANERLEDIFAEQVRRVRSAGVADWEKALRRALRESTHWDSTHPCLKDRLKALRVSPKKALRLAMDLSGEPATALFANWPVVEKFLTERIINIVRENYVARMEYEQVVGAVMRRAAERAAGRG
jgi:Zn-dependent protease with chaperone function